MIGTLLLVTVGTVVGGLSTALAARTRQNERYRAVEIAARFRAEAVETRNLLSLIGPAQPVRRELIRDRTRRALTVVGALCDQPICTRWWEEPPARLLAFADREELRREAGDLFLWLAQAQLDLAADGVGARGLVLDEALTLNRRAETCFPNGTPRAVWLQRALIHHRRLDVAAERDANALAARTPLKTAEDYRLAATERLFQQNYVEALPLFVEAIERDPSDYSSWLSAGVCQMKLSDHKSAAASFSTCIALWRDHPAAWFDRALNDLRSGRPTEAVADFDRVIALRPNEPDPVLNRALALLNLKRFPEAVEGLTRALALGAQTPRTYFMRSRARDEAHDPEGARADRDEGFRRAPVDALDLVARAKFRDDEHDHVGALADYGRALERDPREYFALVNKAALLSDSFADHEGAARVLERLLRIYPYDSRARADLGVLHARLGRRDDALAAASVLAHESRPEMIFRTASIYALTSPGHPDDADRAFSLLDRALTAGFGLDLVDDDADLDAVRDAPRFARIVALARANAESPQRTRLSGPADAGPPPSRAGTVEASLSHPPPRNSSTH